MRTLFVCGSFIFVIRVRPVITLLLTLCILLYIHSAAIAFWATGYDNASNFPVWKTWYVMVVVKRTCVYGNTKFMVRFCAIVILNIYSVISEYTIVFRIFGERSKYFWPYNIQLSRQFCHIKYPLVRILYVLVFQIKIYGISVEFSTASHRHRLWPVMWRYSQSYEDGYILLLLLLMMGSSMFVILYIYHNYIPTKIYLYVNVSSGAYGNFSNMIRKSQWTTNMNYIIFCTLYIYIYMYLIDFRVI